MLQPKRKSALENYMPEKKSRKYNNSYLDFWFTFTLHNRGENLSLLFAASYGPVIACYQISLNVT